MYSITQGSVQQNAKLVCKNSTRFPNTEIDKRIVAGQAGNPNSTKFSKQKKSTDTNKIPKTKEIDGEITHRWNRSDCLQEEADDGQERRELDDFVR